MAESEPAWSWPEEKWQSAVAGLRAGRSLKPKKWKGGARALMALGFDCTHEVAALTDGAPTSVRLAEGQYASRQGLPRILRLLKAHGAQATFFYPAVSAMMTPEDVKLVAGAGHEVAACSWIGEDLGLLDHDTAQGLLAGCCDTLERITGARPRGFRATGGALTPALARQLRDNGFIWDASLGADDDPHELLADGEPLGLVEIPHGRTCDDLAYFAAGQPGAPETVFDIFRREMEMAYEEGGVFTLTLHPDLIGKRSRIWILEELLKIARTLPGMRFSTHGELAAACGARGAA
ncbi:MAG: polysaccharide deacetylase family protein [Proteobacteria bacterium]|nr:polysaccharide deacetylase family protein [Pseudomonadota bacterium]